MKCPQCDHPIPSTICSACGAESPPDSLFCCRCGHRVEQEEPVDSSERTPCSDGTCIGTINENRVCNVCGKPYTN